MNCPGIFASQFFAPFSYCSKINTTSKVTIISEVSLTSLNLRFPVSNGIVLLIKSLNYNICGRDIFCIYRKIILINLL